MTIHLIKLAVGVDDLEHLRKLQKQRRKERRQKPSSPHWVFTRNTPRRADELLDGGSLYWVIRGQIMCREPLRAIRPYRDKEGVGRCRLVLGPKIVLVEPRPFRAFQGWRYLEEKDAPRDLDRAAPGARNMPEELRRELRGLGLL